MRKLLGLAVAAVAIGLLSASATAGPVTFLMGNGEISSIGDEIGSPWDQFSAAGLAGTASGLQTVADLSLNGGTGNCNSCTLTPTGTLPVALTVGGVTHNVGINWSWSSNTVTDTLAFGPISPLVYQLGGGEVVAVNFVTPAALQVSAGAPISEGPLQANFTVPEPGSLALLGTGLFGLIGLGLLRRQPGPDTLA